jgi:hypothetical protein
MWSQHRLFAWLALPIILAGCGSASEQASTGPDAGQAPGDAAVFVAAPWPPPDICGLLTMADVQTLLPDADSTSRPGPWNPDGAAYWFDSCDWGNAANPAGALELTLVGALTPEGATILDENLTDPDLTRRAQLVSGVGTQAAYIDFAGGPQVLNVRFKSYEIELTAASITPDVTEDLLHPLAVKVVGEL